jgi:hypothetical protein
MAGHPGTLPLRLYRGDSYSWQVRVWLDEAHTSPMDLAGATAAGQIGGADGAIEIDCTVTLPNLVGMTLPAENWNGGLRYDRWDLQLTWTDGRVYTLLAGPVTVTDDVTP